MPLPEQDLASRDLPLDKVAHLALYFGLGWTLGRALARRERLRVGSLGTAWLGGLAFAGLDEWHQTWLAAREASIPDWTADAVGLTLGLAAVFAVVRLRTGTARGGGRKPSTRSERSQELPSGRAPGRGSDASPEGEERRIDE